MTFYNNFASGNTSVSNDLGFVNDNNNIYITLYTPIAKVLEHAFT